MLFTSLVRKLPGSPDTHFYEGGPNVILVEKELSVQSFLNGKNLSVRAGTCIEMNTSETRKQKDGTLIGNILTQGSSGWEIPVVLPRGFVFPTP